jgi:hypothetical protein
VDLQTVPDFFQEETADALRDQVDWLIRQVGVDEGFFQKVLGQSEAVFSPWREGRTPLSEDAQETLRELWRTVLHLLSFLNFEEKRVRELFEKTMPNSVGEVPSGLTPPWRGASLKAYLERAGAKGIKQVAAWVTGLRFGDPYAA